MNCGSVDARTIGGLINSISRFIHLVICQTMKTAPVQKDYRTMVGILKLLKPVLDEVVDSQIPSDPLLLREIEELDAVVNEAREFMERQCPKMSNIYSVLQSEPFVMKIQSSSVEICRILSGLLQLSPFTLYSTRVQHCMQELQCAEQEMTLEHLQEALRDQSGNVATSSENLLKIAEFLGLTSNHELLMEIVALEKERLKAEHKKKKGEVELIDQIIALVNCIRDCMGKLEQFVMINGKRIPSYFCCPLSLELMSDPVILASGQTYERAFIQKWLDHGMNFCPKTHQILSHTNLIPNYTVKAMIASWCEENNIRIHSPIKSDNMKPSSISHTGPKDISPIDSFRDSVHSDSTSRSTVEVVNGNDKKALVVSNSNREVDSCDVIHQPVASDKVTLRGNPSPELTYCHSRSESVSSAISSIEYITAASQAVLTEASRASSKYYFASEMLGEVTSDWPASSPPYKDSVFSPWLSRRSQSSVSDLGLDDSTNSSYVFKLVEDLKSQSHEVQLAAAGEVRFLAKHNMENRVLIAKCGAISPLITLLYSKVKKIQENAVTALLNLSINDGNKSAIAEGGAIEPLIYVLKTGNAEARENSAATLFSLSSLEEYKIKIGRSAAVKALVDLLGSGTLRGKKDAATALFNLSIFHENKARIVQAGAVKQLIVLLDPDTGMIDKAVALLANLSTIQEGRIAIAQEGGIPLLVEVVETGSQRGKENAAATLLQLCINSHKFCTLVLQEGAVPPLIALSQLGTPRAKEKAQQILSHFRSQREGSTGKIRS
ncbi:U-box domain-containing protein 3 [Acorus calamus]|uniref:RING-type E3 ubiquitin transferase n=2 Tax=Acorus calamus TaxID=4465 RepID=A0AAV9CQU7_ACOCL|nr:U-box domain-containing protein 3 [Acorus calamus]